MGISTVLSCAFVGLGGRGVERRFTFGLLAFILVAGAFLAATRTSWPEALPRALERVDARIGRDGRNFESEDDRQRVRLKAVKVGDLARTCVWWATLVNAVLAGGLLATRRIWGRPLPVEAVPVGVGPPWRRRRFWLALGLILLGATVIRLPRMGLSLYNDEAYNFTRYIHGQFKSVTGDPESEPRFVPVAWTETLWDNHQGNNGVLYSLLARGCHELWATAAGAVEGEFREWPLRLPALVPGVLSIGILSLLGARLGGTWTGWAVAVVAAVHPWHVRYSTDGRPYGLVLFGVSLALYALTRGLEDGRWRWWLLYGFGLFVALGAFVGALHAALGLNAVVFCHLVIRWAREKNGIGRDWVALLMGRLIAANVLAAMLYLQVLAPILPQMKPAITVMLGNAAGVGPWSLVPDVSSYLVTGMPWTDSYAENRLTPSLERLLQTPALGIPFLLGVLGLLLAGTRAILRAPAMARIAVLGGLAAVLSALSASALSGITLHRWYLIHALPAATLLLGFGVAGVLRSAGNSGPAKLLPLIPLVWLAGVLSPVSSHLRQGREDLLGIIQAVRGGRYPFTEAQRRVLLGAFWSDPVYCPDLVYTPEAGDIDRLVEKARREGRPLYVEYGHRSLALRHHPETVARLEDAEDFELTAVFPGLEEEQFTHYLFRFTGSDGQTDPDTGATRPPTVRSN